MTMSRYKYFSELPDVHNLIQKNLNWSNKQLPLFLHWWHVKFLETTYARLESGWLGPVQPVRIVQTGSLGGSPPITSTTIECSLMRWLIGSIIALGGAINIVKRNTSHSYVVSFMWDLFQSQPLLYHFGRQLFGHLLCMSSNMVRVDWCKYPVP